MAFQAPIDRIQKLMNGDEIRPLDVPVRLFQRQQHRNRIRQPRRENLDRGLACIVLESGKIDSHGR